MGLHESESTVEGKMRKIYQKKKKKNRIRMKVDH